MKKKNIYNDNGPDTGTSAQEGSGITSYGSIKNPHDKETSE